MQTMQMPHETANLRHFTTPIVYFLELLEKEVGYISR
jgi:hypothetical protein